MVDEHVDIDGLAHPPFIGEVVLVFPFAFVLSALSHLLPREAARLVVETRVVPS